MKNQSIGSGIITSSTDMRFGVNSSAVYRHGLAAYERSHTQQGLGKKGQNPFVDEPGLLAIAEIVGYSSDATIEARQQLHGKPVSDRITAAVRYMEEVAEALDTAGRVSGILDNAAITAFTPDQATSRQREIWAGEKSLLTDVGLTEFLQACCDLDFQVGDSIVQSGAEVLRNAYGQIGAPTANTWATLVAMAQEDSLNVQTFKAVFKALHRETAHFEACPPEAIRAIRDRRQAETGLRA